MLSGMPRYGTTPSERATMARTLAFLFGAGATLVLATMLLPQVDHSDDLPLATAVAAAYATTGVLLAGAGRIRPGVLQAVLLLGTFLIGVCVVAGGESASAYSFMYVWVALYALAFLPVVSALGHIVAGAASFAAGLVLQPDLEVPVTHWLMGVGSFVVASVMIARLTGAIRARAADLAEASSLGALVSDVARAAEAACEGLQRSARADAVVLLAAGTGGLRVETVSGSAEAAMAFAGERARLALERCFATGEPQVIEVERRRGLLGRARCSGLAQPVLRDGAPAAVLAVAWTSPRRAVPDRVRAAAPLFAAKVGLAMEGALRGRRERERHALEINDAIVQGLVMAKYTAQRGDGEASLAAIDETLHRAQALISEQLRWVGGPEGDIRPGDLARDTASTVGG
jgi:hypothetical protein